MDWHTCLNPESSLELWRNATASLPVEWGETGCTQSPVTLSSTSRSLAVLDHFEPSASMLVLPAGGTACRSSRTSKRHFAINTLSKELTKFYCLSTQTVINSYDLNPTHRASPARCDPHHRISPSP